MTVIKLEAPLGTCHDPLVLKNFDDALFIFMLRLFATPCPVYQC